MVKCGAPLCSNLEGGEQKGGNDVPEILRVFMPVRVECVVWWGARSGGRLIERPENLELNKKA